MKLAVFGASGMLGQVLLKEVLAANHTVTALVRSPDKVSAFYDQITIVEGDYFDAHARAKTLEGADAVLSTIGPPMSRTSNNGEYSKAIAGLIEQMQSKDIKRIVAIGGAGLLLADEKLSVQRRLMRMMLILMGGKGYRDKEGEHNVLCASPMDWTIQRPPQITTASGQFVTSDDGPATFKVDPVQLARYMIEILTEPETVRTAPFVASQ